MADAATATAAAVADCASMPPWRVRSRDRLESGAEPLFPLLPFMTPATLELCRTFGCGIQQKAAPVPRTCFVCSYPKSGTTWMQNIVYQVQICGGAAMPCEHNDMILYRRGSVNDAGTFAAHLS